MQVYEESLNKGEDQEINRDENLNPSDKLILNPRETDAKVRAYIDGFDHATAGNDWMPVKYFGIETAQAIYNLYYTFNRGKLEKEFPKEHALCIDLLRNNVHTNGKIFREVLKALLKANVLLSSSYVKEQLIVTLNPNILAFGGYFSQGDDELADMDWLYACLKPKKHPAKRLNPFHDGKLHKS